MPRRNAPRTREPIAVRVRPEFKIALEEYVESRRQAGEADLCVGHVMEALRLEPDPEHPVTPLLTAHERLDVAVAAAYGWEWPLVEEEVLGRLLKLNRERGA